MKKSASSLTFINNSNGFFKKHFPFILNSVEIGQNRNLFARTRTLLCRRLQSVLISVTLQLRAKVLHFHISSGFLLVTVVRQERQILGHFEVTEALETKRQIIDFNRSCLKLFITVIWQMLPPSLEPAFFNGTRNGVVQNQCNKTTHCHACFKQYRHYLVNFGNTYWKYWR